MLVMVAVLAMMLAACGDDGGDVRDLGSDGTSSGSASGSASGSGSVSTSGSASGSATGLAEEDLEGETDDPLVLSAVDGYKSYVVDQIDQLIADTTVFTDAVRAGDLEAAQAAYAPSRVSWERIEPIAGLIEEIDGAVDARVDDFAGTDDPAFTGWHRLEYLLFEQQVTEGGVALADGLDENLQTLKTGMADLELPPAAVAIGAAELIEEVSEGKITGEEDRYSKTDLWDFAANVEGAERIIELLSPALEATDPGLLEDVDTGFAELNETLSPFRDGDGWVLYCQEDDPYPSPRCPDTTVTAATIDLLKAQLAGLSENISMVAGALGLQ